MKIQCVSQPKNILSSYLQPANNFKKSEVKKQTYVKDISPAYYTDKISSSNKPMFVVFKGCKIHILDGGIHGRNMEYFMKSLRPTSEILMHDVEINMLDKNKYTKQLKSLLEQLKALNNRNYFEDNEYIAIPCLASVPILNVQDQYNKIMHEDKKFTPENIKANRLNILSFLEKIYNNQEKYSEYIHYMDTIGFGIEYTYPVIKEINKLAFKTKNIYVPSGHPADLTLKWMADKKNLKPELYHYIATGEDINNSVQQMQKEIKEKNWYSFNLLALSDANIVGLKDTDWVKDFIFAGYDSCITESARGVYNFTPIRENGRVIGYSFHDDKTNEYPYDKFPMNDKIQNLLDFIGKDINSVLATNEETKKLLAENSYNRGSELYSKKLYRVEDIFTPYEIEKNKIKLQGKFVDSVGKTFYDVNDNGKIIFKKCDCEGNGRPSVLTMWGSCFALFNVISNRIDSRSRYTKLEKDFLSVMRTADTFKSKSMLKEAEEHYHHAATVQKILEPNINVPDAVRVYEELSEIYAKRKDYENAKNCINMALFVLANQFFSHSRYKNLGDIEKSKNIYYESLRASEKFDNEPALISFPLMNDVIIQTKFEMMVSSFLRKNVFKKPYNYNVYKQIKYIEGKDEHNYYNKRFYKYYCQLSDFCSKLGEDYASKICAKAASDINLVANSLEYEDRAMQIIRRRKDGIIYIGDLYESK